CGALSNAGMNSNGSCGLCFREPCRAGAPNRALHRSNEAPQSLDPLSYLALRPDGLGGCRLDEAETSAERHLAESPEIGFDHDADDRISPGRVRVARLDDRQPVRRQLYDTRNDAVRQNLGTAARF